MRNRNVVGSSNESRSREQRISTVRESRRAGVGGAATDGEGVPAVSLDLYPTKPSISLAVPKKP